MSNMGHLHNVPPLLGISRLQQGLPEVLGASRHRSGAPNLHAAVDQSWALVNGAACWTPKMLVFFLAAIHLRVLFSCWIRVYVGLVCGLFRVGLGFV